MNIVQWFQSSMTRRIAGTMALLTLVIVMGLGTATYFGIRTLIRQNIGDALRRDAEHIAFHIEAFLDALNDNAEGLANNFIVKNAVKDKQIRERYLVPFLRTYQLPEQISFTLDLCDQRGTPLAGTSETTGTTYPRSAALLDQVIGRGLPYAAILHGEKNRTLLLAYPVHTSLSPTASGMLVWEIALDEVFRHALHADSVQKDMNITVKCCDDTIWSRIAQNRKDRHTIDRPLTQLRRPMDGLSLVLTVDESEGRAFAPLHMLTALYGIAGVVIIMVTIIAARIMAKRVAAPLVSLTAAADKVTSSGSLAVTIEPHGQDEIGSLAQAFNTMLARLREATEGLEQRVDERTRDLERSSEELAEEKNKSEAIIAALGDGISIQDRNYRVLYQNDVHKELIGDHLGELCHAAYERQEAVCEGCPVALSFQDGGVHNVERSVDFPDGRQYFDITASPLRDATGEIVGGIELVRNITKRKRTELALEELNRDLARRVEEEVAKNREKDRIMMVQSRQAAMGEMLGNIAHQWRQPLNIVGLIIQDLQDAQLHGQLTPDYVDKSVQRGMDVIQHMSQTIDDFRGFYRTDKGKRTFVLNEVIGRVLSFIEASFRNMNITLDVHLEDAIETEGYPNEFAQVLLNILNNARDVLLERKVRSPKVSVRLARQDGRPVVTIGDNGGGIAGDHQEHLFEPFFTTKEEGKGTGIGLYMSKNIVEKNMSGRLTVRNTAEGAEFRIEL